MTDKRQQPTKETEKNKDALPIKVIFEFGKMTDAEVAEIKAAFLSLPPDASFVHAPKRICDPRRARPI